MSCHAVQQESEFLGPHPMMEPLEATAAQAIISRRAGLSAALAGQPVGQVRYCSAPAFAARCKTAFCLDACQFKLRMLRPVPN